MSATIHKNIIETVKQRIPGEENITEVLSRFLSINKSAIYRRIDGQVPFTFQEMVAICENLNISLDEITGNLPGTYHFLSMRIISHHNPSEKELDTIRQYADTLKYLSDFPNSKMESANNFLPEILFVPYENLSRFYMFKWIYQYGQSRNNNILYKNTYINEEYRKLQFKCFKGFHNFALLSFIFDYLLFYFIISDLKYFFTLKLITKEELKLIQQDLFFVLDDLERACANGKYKNYDQKFSLYVSNINFYTNYCYIQAGNLYVSHIKAFLLQDLTTTFQKSFLQMEERIRSLKRHSIMISQSGEKVRIKYFEDQRLIVQSLTDPDINTDDFLFLNKYE